MTATTTNHSIRSTAMKTAIPLICIVFSRLSASADLDFPKMIQTVPLTAKFEDPGKGTSLAPFESIIGIDWKPSANPLVSTLKLAWADGTNPKLLGLERPQACLENGEPAVLLRAAALPGKLDDSFNVQIPLNTKPHSR
jgi:hypothetical protein